MLGITHPMTQRHIPEYSLFRNTTVSTSYVATMTSYRDGFKPGTVIVKSNLVLWTSRFIQDCRRRSHYVRRQTLISRQNCL